MSVVRLLLPEGGLERWHRALAERLAADGHCVSVTLCPRRGPPPPSTALIETLEDLLHRGRRPSETAPEPPGAWSAAREGDAHLVFDLTGSTDAAPGAVVPCFDGMPGDGARDAALLAGRAPWIEFAMMGDEGPLVYASALPALPSGRRLNAGRAAVALALSALVRRLAASGLDAGVAPHASDAPSTQPGRGFAAALPGLIAKRLRRLIVHDDHWRIGLRQRAAGDALLTGLEEIDAPPWGWLADDRRRYFADPFLFEEGGVAYLFCEEFPYATGKGVISVVALDEAGNPGPAQVVLERPYHLSYPVVFRAEGQIWMMPESGASRTLDLYRAERFPDRWVFERTLISGVELADATPFAWGGQYWLTATTSDTVGSSWDSLTLFSGAGPLGPWTQMSEGPMLIDASAARPAGLPFMQDGALWRPAQDCRGGYGAGLAFCRIDALGPDLFAQTPMRRFTPRGGMHTFNASERFVVIDVAGPRARAPWLDGFAS
jgi:hypothetical protein